MTSDQVHATVERGYGLHVLTPLVDLPQGVHSRAWLAHTDDGDWVVKVSDPRSDPPAALTAQCELFGYLNSRGLHTPEVRADLTGNQVSTVVSPPGEFPVTMMRYHQLHRLSPESVSADDLRQVAGQIARLHATMDEFPNKPDIVSDQGKAQNEWGQQVTGCYPALINSPTAEWFTTAELTWIAAIDTRLIAYIDDHLPDPSSLSQAVLHGDLSFEHVRLLPDRQVYFFDFGDMCWGPVAHELAQFLRGFRDTPISFERWADLRRWLLEGYRSRRVFTATDAAAIDAFLLNRVVALAKYVLELADDSENASGNAAEVIKNAYQLADTML